MPLHPDVKISQNPPNEQTKGYLFRAGCRKGVSHRQLRFGTDSKAGRQRMGKLYSGKKGWLQERPHWGLWAWGSWRGLTTRGASHVIGEESISGFLRLVLSWKWG